MADPSGRKIASYEVEDELGQGGMGVVFLARQPSLERRVVLKTLRRDLADDPTSEERFTREVRRLEDRGLIAIGPEISERDPYAQERIVPTRPLPLNGAQEKSLKEILAGMDFAGRPPKEAGQKGARSSVFLLHGLTGSGKTEVYLQAIDHALERGQGAIVLVPEISLTPQTVERFKARFSAGSHKTLVAVLHSHLTTGERHDEWHKIRQGRARIAIGARSAIFAPVEPLGLIIVDEEHEHTYKQEEAPRYHARDVAIVRGQMEGAVVVLGSATPSLESCPDEPHRSRISPLRGRDRHEPSWPGRHHARC